MVGFHLEKVWPASSSSSLCPLHNQLKLIVAHSVFENSLPPFHDGEQNCPNKEVKH